MCFIHLSIKGMRGLLMGNSASRTNAFNLFSGVSHLQGNCDEPELFLGLCKRELTPVWAHLAVVGSAPSPLLRRMLTEARGVQQCQHVWQLMRVGPWTQEICLQGLHPTA